MKITDDELKQLLSDAAKAGVTEYKKQEKKERKKDKYHDTFSLMKCYRDAVFHKENAISELNPIHNSLYLLQNGIAKDMFTHQLFKDSASISTSPELGEHLILDLETRRKFSINNRNIAVIQCGENNILRNIQSEDNKTVFRLENNPKLHQRFSEFLESTNIILNPIHSPMGNQGKMRKRREYFSNNNRAYFSTANFNDENSINNKSIQYACINGKELEPSNIEIDKRNSYIIRTFIL